MHGLVCSRALEFHTGTQLHESHAVVPQISNLFLSHQRGPPNASLQEDSLSSFAVTLERVGPCSASHVVSPPQETSYPIRAGPFQRGITGIYWFLFTQEGHTEHTDWHLISHLHNISCRTFHVHRHTAASACYWLPDGPSCAP